MIRYLAGAILVATLAAGAAWAGTVSVNQKNLKFSVNELKVAKGDIVEFTNGDSTSHNITIKGEGFSVNSGLQSPGQPFSTPLVKPGRYTVTCGIHPRMKMTIVVE